MSPSRNQPLCLRCRSAVAGFLWRTASRFRRRQYVSTWKDSSIQILYFCLNILEHTHEPFNDMSALSLKSVMSCNRKLLIRIHPHHHWFHALFLRILFQFKHVLIKVRHEQSILDDTVFFKFCLSMKLCNFCGHLACIL